MSTVFEKAAPVFLLAAITSSDPQHRPYHARSVKRQGEHEEGEHEEEKPFQEIHFQAGKKDTKEEQEGRVCVCVCVCVYDLCRV
jgi:hypothetical protein